MMGGVTGTEFWRTFLALVSALCVSLAAGMFISAISRDSQKVLVATVVLLGLLIAGGPASDAALAAVKPGRFSPLFSRSSPFYLFMSAGAWGGASFWSGFLANQAVAWTLLALACVALPRAWQEGPGRRSSLLRNPWALYWKFGGANRRHALRIKLIEPNPVFWLACPDYWQPLAFWGLTLLVVGGFVAIFARDNPPGVWMSWNFVGGTLTLALYLWIASQAARFFVEVRRSGLVELLLATPLRVDQIVRGQWRALLWMFGLPLALCLAVELLGTFLVQQKTWNSLAATAATMPTPAAMPTNASVVSTNTTIVATTGPGAAAFSVGNFVAPNEIVLFAMSLAEVTRIIANLTALMWFGMWMGLTSKNTNLAALKAIVFVQIIPWFVVSFVSGIAVPLFLIPGIMRRGPTVSAQMLVWYPLLFSGLSTALFLTKDLVFSLWARRKLYLEFRERAAPVAAPVRPLPPPLLPRAAPPPFPAQT